MSDDLRAPFPWFGGKRRVSDEVWSRFGVVDNYVEPFFGSGAVLLGRPSPSGVETVNDLDGFVANFWRSMKSYPDELAQHADWPVNENDLHARHAWLIGHVRSLREKLEGDPDFCDVKIAGWWVWGLCSWIGSGWCSARGPWVVEDGRLVLGDAGQGVNRQLPHLGNAFAKLSDRMRNVRVCSGDWSRVCGPSVTFKHGMTGVFLDPPYADSAERESGLYREDSESVAHDVRAWAVENGANPLMRIALCGYEGEHEMPEDWSVHQWNAGQGFGGQAVVRTQNGKRERIWFSPHCLSDSQGRLF